MVSGPNQWFLARVSGFVVSLAESMVVSLAESMVVSLAESLVVVFAKMVKTGQKVHF